jgi:hypothetical protein
MSEQPVLDVFDLERFLEQRIITEIDHAHREVVTSVPPSVHQAQLFGRAADAKMFGFPGSALRPPIFSSVCAHNQWYRLTSLKKTIG